MADAIFSVGTLRRGEPTATVAGEVLQTARVAGLLCTKLEVLGRQKFGSKEAIRFRIDLDAISLLTDALIKDGRDVVKLVSPEGFGYFAANDGVRKGNVSLSVMLAAPRENEYHVFRGTAIKYWERQFPNLQKYP